MLRQHFVSTILISLLGASCAPRATKPPATAPDPGLSTASDAPSEPGGISNNVADSNVADSNVVTAAGGQDDRGPASGSTAPAAAGKAPEDSSVPTSPPEASWTLLPVEGVTVEPSGDLWRVRATTSTPSADWTVVLRPREAPAEAAAHGYSVELLLLGRRTKSDSPASVTAAFGELETSLGTNVSTVIVTGQRAGSEQSVIEEVPRVAPD